MIVVDTSVWVTALRDPVSPTAETLRALIDADEVCVPLPVRLELMAGLRRDTRASVRRALTALPVAVPTEETWRIVERWVETASDAGQRFALIALLIAALTHEMTGLLWSLDGDFERMATLGLVQSYQVQSYQ
jgi:predicted nucleic acid-binding protein